MNNKQEHQRLSALFADLERLAVDPASNTQQMSQQLEALRAQLLELEQNFLEAEINASAQDDKLVDGSTNRPAATIIYEKDQLGYGYSNDKLEALQGSMHTLPNLNDATTSLLTIGGQTIGEMQIEPASERPLTQSDMELVNVITQQASLQIQNLRLLSAAERSRAQAETATRRFMHESWDTYLDAINQSERIGYAYDQSSVTPYSNKLHVNGGVHESVQVMDEEVGALYLKPDPNRPLTNADKELVSAVANQVAQQVENIRLLADASRARAEAEEAIRRLTRR